MPTAEAIDYEQALVEKFYDLRWDPLGCVLFSFPWGEGELVDEPGPRKFQRKFLTELGDHLQNPKTRHTVFRKAVSSGHGIGKSALVGQIVHWAKSTCVDCKVLVTANTGLQLETKTQPEIAKWFRLAINKDWFDVHVKSIKINEAEHEATWRADFATWSEDNPQAFAGAHNKGRRLVIVFDEAAGIPDSIWKVIEGALTDANTEIIWIAFSQAFKSEGAFYEAVFGNQRHRWRPEIIDSRNVEGINVAEIEESIKIYGEDSDHVRVRYRGLFPTAGGGKFFDLSLVTAAQRRPAGSLDDDPLVVGVDFAWGGADDNVIRFRKGLDAKSIPPIKVKGEFTKSPSVMIGKLADVLSQSWGPGRDQVAMCFFDSAGIAAPVKAGLDRLGFEDQITIVNFGAESLDPDTVYMRDYMWHEMKKWMRDDGGAIDDDSDLAADLQKPLLVYDRLQRIKLESKDDMKKRLQKLGFDSTSPDDGDALALTFAFPVKAPRKKKPKSSGSSGRRLSPWG